MPAHGETCRRYRLALQQRTRLLGDLATRADGERLLAPWDEQLAALGSEIVHRRARDARAASGRGPRGPGGARARRGQRAARLRTLGATGRGSGRHASGSPRGAGTTRAEDLRRGLTRVGPHPRRRGGAPRARRRAARPPRAASSGCWPWRSRLGVALVVRRRHGASAGAAAGRRPLRARSGGRRACAGVARGQGQVVYTATDAQPAAGGAGTVWQVAGGRLEPAAPWPEARHERPPKGARRGARRDLHRERHQGPRGARGRPQAAGHVHRGHGELRPPPPGVRGRRQLGRRGARGLLLEHPGRPSRGGSCTVIDDGRGIPVDVHTGTGKSAAEVVLTTAPRGREVRELRYKVSGGLHGVGVSVVNALSEWLEVEIRRDGRVYTQRYDRGKPQSDLQAGEKATKRGTTIRFKPDPEIFEITTFSFDVLANRLRELAFLNKGAQDPVRGRAGREEGHVPLHRGHPAYVEYLAEGKEAVHPEVHVRRRGSRGHPVVEVSLQYNDGYNETITFRQQYQHPRGRHAPQRIPHGADGHDQPLRGGERPDERVRPPGMMFARD